MVKKLLTIFLAAAMLFSVVIFVASCNSDKTDTTTKDKTETTAKDTSVTTAKGEVTTDDVTETTAEPNGREKLSGYEDVDFGGLTFLINATVSDPAEGWHDDKNFWVEDVTGNALDDAVYERNQVMKKLYNCEIMVDASGGSEYSANIASGSQKYIGTTAAYAALSIASDKYYNVLKFDVDFSQPWWDQNFFNDLSCDGKLFAMCGAFSICAKRAVWITYYNKDVYDTKFADIDIYQMVRDYKWTYDAMVEFIDKIKYDANGDSTYSFTDGSDADILGYVSTGHNPRYLYFAGGRRYVVKSENSYDGYFVSALNDPKGVDTLEQASKVIFADGYLELGYSSCDKAMMNGTTLFVSNVMGQLEVYETAEDLRVGILPMPMPSADQQRYYHLPDNHSTFLSIPTSYANLEVISQFLTLFAYHSYKLVYPAFLNTYKYTYASDEESGEMVDLITNSICYDPGYIGSMVVAFDGFILNVVKNKRIGDFTNAATRYTTNCESSISDYRSKIAKIDDNY